MSQGRSSAKKDGRAPGAGGHRLATAFEVVSKLPALAEAQKRLIGLCERQASSPGDITEAIESDAALAVAVMKAANNGNGPSGRAGGVREAIEELTPEGVRTVVSAIDTYDVLTHPGLWAERFERFRRHAVSVRVASERIAEVSRLPQRDELAVAALLHDVGRLVVAELYGDENLSTRKGESPEDGVRRERRELGIDHALVGAVLVRRWGLKGVVATAVERHHAPNASGLAAAIRLGDLVVHHASGDTVTTEAMREAASSLEIDDDTLSALLFEFPAVGEKRRRSSEPCPLSMREIDALRGLSEGKVYKQIAQELSLSVSTVRTHLHNVYRKIGAVDRAQAVIIASDRGWL